MCLSCGCYQAHDHGQPANITYEDVKRAADANSLGVAESLLTILDTAKEDRATHRGQYETGGDSILGAMRHNGR